jgi:hypothetical protein
MLQREAARSGEELWGYGPSGVLGWVVVIVLVLMGRLWRLTGRQCQGRLSRTSQGQLHHCCQNQVWQELNAAMLS